MGQPHRPAQLTRTNAEAFQLPSVVAAYHLRTPYPAATFPFLLQLAQPLGGPVLELGCGTGELARGLAPSSERVDAIDLSAAMLERARSMPGGDRDNIRWIEGQAETATLEGPYALAIAGDSFHWMAWEVVLERVVRALAADALIAIVSAQLAPVPWADALTPIIGRHSVIQDFEPYDFIALLRERQLLDITGDERVGDDPFTRTVDEYISSLHATAGMPRERMGGASAQAFDEAVRRLVEPHAQHGALQLRASARIVWGRPAI